ncbi:MAG: hypothetical protein ACJ0E8_01925 [Gammaproteobacteria bacterium]
MTGRYYSPSSGVIDVPEYVTALEGDIQHFGGLDFSKNVISMSS